MPRGASIHIACWEVSVAKDEVEGLLATTRERSPGLIVQVFGSSGAPNPATVEMLAAQTLEAIKSGSTLAERPELDLLLRLAGTRQIGEAFQRVGYKSSGRRLFMVAVSSGKGAELRRLVEGLEKDGRFVAVPRKELEKGDLDQVERAALLAARV